MTRLASVTGLLVIACCCCGFVSTVTAQVESAQNSLAEFCLDLPRPEYAALERLPIQTDLDQNWFEIYEVSSGVTAIYEPFQWQEVISYLIEGEKEALLFDSGNGMGDMAALVSSLTDKPVSVLNSHTHFDHVGGNHAFQKIYGMDTAYSRANHEGFTNEEISMEASPAALCRSLPVGVRQETHVGMPYRVTDYLEDGAVIDLGGRELEVIHLPGHTPDAIALIDRSEGLMWTGDSYYSGPIWLFVPETDLDAYTRSLDRLIEEIPNVTALLPAHNTPWVDPAVLIRVKRGYELMIGGGADRHDWGDGMVEYRLPGEATFSFLMRDEPLPYAK